MILGNSFFFNPQFLLKCTIFFSLLEQKKNVQVLGSFARVCYG